MAIKESEAKVELVAQWIQQYIIAHMKTGLAIPAHHTPHWKTPEAPPQNRIPNKSAYFLVYSIFWRFSRS
eukprot:3993226-Amphidinium_carterae.1